MKNERGPKPGPKRTPKSEGTSRSKPGSKREPRAESGPEAKKSYKPAAKTGANAASKREQRLELESNLKKEFRPETKPAAKKPMDGAFSPKTGLKRPVGKAGETRQGAADVKGERSGPQAFPAKRYINVYLGLGSNMGNRMANLRDAAGLIDKTIGKIARKSHVYETEPWGQTDQDNFLNQVLMVNTTLDPRDMLEKITLIERELGREKTEKWGPRTIDIDILFYGKRVVRDKGLDIPHPELHKRAFVLVPLMEIAPELEHPVLKQPIDELYMACKDPSEVVMLD